MFVDGIEIDTTGATTNQVLKFDGTKFAPGSDTGLAGTVHTSTIGDGSATSFTITHSLGTRDVVVVARNAASPYEVIDVRWEATTTGTVTLDFSAAPSASSVRVGVYSAVAGSTITIGSIDDLGDVTLSSAANGDFLRYNGSVWINDAVNLSTDTIGNYVESLVAGTGITLTNGSAAEGGTPTIAVTASTYDAYGAAATAAGTAYANSQTYTNAAVRSFEINGDSGGARTITTGNSTTSGDTLTILGGTGLTSVTSDTDTITINLDNTAVTGGSYGNANTAASFTVDAQGRLTSASQNAISILASQVSDFAANTRAQISVSGDLAYNSSTGVISFTNDAGDIESVAAGTGLTGGGTSGAVTLTLANTAVTAGSYGAAGTVGTFTVDAQGRLTSAGNTTISVTASQISDRATNLVTGLTGTANEITVSNSGVGAVTLSLPANVTISNNLTVTGNLTVNGNVTTLNTETLAVEDNIIVLNSNVTGAAATNAGIEVERGTDTNVVLRWDESVDKWQFTNDGTNYANLGDVTAAALIAAAGGDGTNGQALTTNGSGTLDFTTIVGTTEASIISAVGADGANGAVLMTNGAGDLTFTTLTAAKISDFTANTRAQISVAGDLAYNSSTGVISFTNDAGDIESVTAGTGLTGGGTSGAVTVSLASTAVTAGSYGSSSSVGTFTVDAQGRLTAAGNSSISITASQVSDFTEAAQDAVEGAITAGTGVTKAYNDNANTISLSIGQDVATNAAVTFGSVATGAITLDSGTGELNTSTQAVTVNTATTVDSFDKTVYRTAKYLIQVTQGSKYTTSEVLLAHDGTDSYLSEYAVIELGASRIPLTVSTSISASNVLLRVTITDAASTSATVKVARTLIAV